MCGMGLEAGPSELICSKGQRNVRGTDRLGEKSQRNKNKKEEEQEEEQRQSPTNDKGTQVLAGGD